jgi:hypothetical protein
MEQKKSLSDYLLDYADIEFNGSSYNGQSLMATLRALDNDEASDTATFEGYSAWELAQHVCFCKFLVARSLDRALGKTGASAFTFPLEPYPFPFTDFAPMPGDRSTINWKNTLDYLERTHAACMQAIRSVPDAILAESMPEWHSPFGSVIAWLLGHDSYHSAQVRNMGIPKLRTKKIER